VWAFTSKEGKNMRLLIYVLAVVSRQVYVPSAAARGNGPGNEGIPPVPPKP